MRRTLPTDTITPAQAQGASEHPDFDVAYAALADARAAYDAVAGRPDDVPSLAAAAERLAVARRDMRLAAAA